MDTDIEVDFCHSFVKTDKEPMGISQRKTSPARFKNMMIDANSRVTMVDFGLAVQVAPGQELHDSCGTVPFASPEVRISCQCMSYACGEEQGRY